MNHRLFLAQLLICTVVGVLWSIPFFPPAQRLDLHYTVEIEETCTTAGHAQLFFDRGSGLEVALALTVDMPKSDRPVRLRFPIPSGHYTQLRIDPIDHPARGSVSGIRIYDRKGKLLYDFEPDEFVAANDLFSLTPHGPQLEYECRIGDPYFTIDARRITLPNKLRIAWKSCSLRAVVGVGVAWLLGAVCLGLFATGKGGAAPADRIAAWASARPKRTLAILGGVATCLACYPVFLGRSHVSPNFGTPLLYEGNPTLPGQKTAAPADSHGADVGAMIWQDVPYSAIHYDGIFRHHTIPLWNRFNAGGNVFLGQGQSMLGNPFFVFVAAADGATWAWDTYFLFTKCAWAIGVALLAYLLTESIGVGACFALSAPFFGFFLFRINHPAIFTFCYAPWILVAWHRIVFAPSPRALAAGLLLWTLANVCVLTSGTVKEAYMLCLALNLVGAFGLLGNGVRSRTSPPGSTLSAPGIAAWFALAAVACVLITAPSWATFLQSLPEAYTTYDQPYALQTPPFLFLGLFDDIFYRTFDPQGSSFNPAANFFIWLGVLGAIGRPTEVFASAFARALAIVSLVALALVFGLVPPSWLKATPFIGQIGHIANTFSCVALICITGLAAYGWKQWLTVSAAATQSLRWFALAVTLALLAAFVGTGRAIYTLAIPPPFRLTSFFFEYTGTLLLCGGILLKLANRSHHVGSWRATSAMLGLAAFFGLHWRMALHAETAFPAWAQTLPARANLRAVSPAIEYVREQSEREPGRVVGTDGNLTTGFTAYYGVEGINGPDAIMNRRYQEVLWQAGMKDRNDWSSRVYPARWEQARRVYDALNVRFVVSPDPAWERSTGLALAEKNDLAVLRNEHAWPRAFWTDRVVAIRMAQDFVDAVNRSDGRPFAAVHPDIFPAIRHLAAWTVPGGAHDFVAGRDYRLGVNDTEFIIDAPRPGIAVLSETYWENGFIATVDGRPTQYFPVNHAFKGVPIDRAGTHRVRFEYRPPHMTLLWSACLGGFAQLGGALLLLCRPPRRPVGIHSA